MDKTFQKLIDKIVDIGDSIIHQKIKVLANNNKDIKINLDVEINQQLVEYLENKFTFPILSEENITRKSFNDYDELVWIIDPLDGSLNFSRNIPINCISIALWGRGTFQFSCIYDFNRKELFTTENKTCLLNNEICQTSNLTKPENGVLCTGFPSWRNYEDESLKAFLCKIQNWKKIRAIGSAALSLAWVARGWADAYIEEDIHIWDVAAGMALVNVAGGDIYLKENDRPTFVTAIATNGKIPIKELL